MIENSDSLVIAQSRSPIGPFFRYSPLRAIAPDPHQLPKSAGPRKLRAVAAADTAGNLGFFDLVDEREFVGSEKIRVELRTEAGLLYWNGSMTPCARHPKQSDDDEENVPARTSRYFGGQTGSCLFTRRRQAELPSIIFIEAFIIASLVSAFVYLNRWYRRYLDAMLENARTKSCRDRPGNEILVRAKSWNN